MANTRSWQDQRGKTRAMDDKVTITITREDLGAYHRALDVAINHLDEARGTEGRIYCADRLIRLKKAALDAIWDHDEVPKSERSYG